MSNITADLLERVHPLEILKLSTEYEEGGVDHILTFLQKNMHYGKAVLNGILIVSLRNVGGHLPPIKYLEMTLDTWKSENRLTARKAANHINRSAIARAKKRAEEQAKQQRGPEWIQEYHKEISEMKG